MAYRKHWTAEALTETSTTSDTTWSTQLSYTFTAANQDASSDYILLWSGEVQVNSTSADVQGRITKGGTAILSFNIESKEVGSPVDYQAVGGMIRVQSAATPADIVLNFDFKNETLGNTAKCKNARFTLLKLGANDAYAESLTRVTTTSTTLQDGASVTFTPPSTGDYLIIGSALLDVNSTSIPSGWKLSDGTNVTAQIASTSSDTTTVYPGVIGWVQTGLTASSKTYKIQYAAGSAGLTTGITGMAIVALRLADFDNAYNTSLGADDTGTSATYTDSLALTQTIPNTNDYLQIAAWWMEGSSTTISSQSRFIFDGSTVINETIREPQNATSGQGAIPVFSHRTSALTAASHNWKIQRLSETTGSTTRTKAGAVIVVLDLGANAPTDPAPSDSVTASESMVRAPSSVLSDSATLSDSLVSSLNKALSDSVTPSESGSVQEISEELSDSVTVTDFCYTGRLDLSDSVSATDALVNAPSSVLADSATPSEALVNAVSHPLTDSATPSDALVNAPSTALSDSATPSDALVNAPSVALADSATPSEALTNAPSVVFADSVTPSESISPVLTSGGLSLNDSVTVSDSGSVSEISETLADSASATDALYPSLQTLAESVTPSDALTQALSTSQADSASVTDAIVFSVSQALADSATATDALANALSTVQTDSATPSDALVNAPSTVLADSASATDTLVNAPAPALSDSVTPSEALTNDVGKVLADSATATEGLTTDASGGLSLSDSATPTDALVSTFNKVLADSVTPTDALTQGYAQALADSVTPSEALANALSKPLADSATPTDGLTTSGGGTLALNDSVTASDSGSVSEISETLTDSATATDALATAGTTSRALADSAAPTDALANSPTKILADSATVSDSVSTSLGVATHYTRSFNDAITTLDANGRRHVSLGTRATSKLDTPRWAPPRVVRPDIIARQIIGRRQTLSPLDTFMVGESARIYQDTAGFADNLASPTDAAVRAYGKVLAESVVVSDGQVLNLYPPKPNDPVTPSDIVVLNPSKVLADSVSVGDSLGGFVINKAISDSVTMADGLNVLQATYVGTTINAADYGDSGRLINFPAGSAAGDIALVFFTGTNVGAMTGSGWTALSYVTPTYGYQDRCYWKVLTAADITATLVGLDTDHLSSAIMVVYRGATGVTVRSQSEYTGTTTTIPGITRGGTSRGLVCWVSDRDTSITLTKSSSFLTSRAATVTSSGSFWTSALADVLAWSDYVNGTNFVFTHSANTYPQSAWVVELTG